MEIPKLTTRQAVLIALALIGVGIAFRLMPHEANFAPITAIALFSGAVLGKRYAAVIPLTILLVSDLIIGTYAGMAYTWLAITLVALYGVWFHRSGFTKRMTAGVVGSSLLFYVVSNFGSWIIGYQYPPTFAGLVECYYMALPFLRNSFGADVFYSLVLFGAYATYAQTVRRRAAKAVQLQPQA